MYDGWGGLERERETRGATAGPPMAQADNDLSICLKIYAERAESRGG